ncbi:MAG: type I-E CRISPR-associated protein Cse2/CasB [Rhodocyclaceae bacterium]
MIRLSPPQKEIVRDWWFWLQPESQNDPAVKTKLAHQFGGFARVKRATLRRCAEPSLVLLEPAFHRLMLKLQAVTEPGDKVRADADAFALVAGLLAWVESEPARDIPDRSFAALLGSPKEKGADRPRMSHLRFARLQTADSEADFYQQFRRAIELAGKQADVVCLAEELLDWQREFHGQKPDKPKDRIQVRWATAYFSALKPDTAAATSPEKTGA